MNIPLKKEQKVKVRCSYDIYLVMRQILLRESRTDRNREHFWTISLDNRNRILNIELVSMGSVNHTLAEPMEVYSIPLQKRAVQIVLVHNHPSGETIPSENDKDRTDHLIQCGRIMHTPVIDHLIISENTYYSFKDSGLLKELEESTKYVPPYILVERAKEEAAEAERKKGGYDKAKEMARAMKQKGFDVKLIEELTGLKKPVILKLKAGNDKTKTKP